MIVYKAVNKKNGKCYIGQTVKTLNERKSGHFTSVRKKDNSYFHKALRKYGKENFEWSVLCECYTKEEMDEKEIYYIQELKSHVKEGNGYNLTLGGGGNLGWIPSEETKRNISVANKGKQLGIPKSEEHKKNIGLGQLGNKRPYQMGDNNVSRRPEVREKISKALKGKKKPYLTERNKLNTGKSYKDIYGKKKANEIKEKQSISHIGIGKDIPKSNETKNKLRESMSKYVYTITTPTGDIEITDSLRNFCKENDVDRNWLCKSYKDNISYKGWYVIRQLIG